MPSSRPPKCGFHKPSGQARVYVNGKSVYLGPHGSDEAKRRYRQVINEWRQQQQRKSTLCVADLTIAELADLFLQHAESYYVKNGRPTSEVLCLKAAIKFVLKSDEQTATADFGPKRLKAVRERMIRAGHARTSINKNCERIRRMFAWGVSEELVPADVLTALRTVRGLSEGRSDAIERPAIKPVPLADVLKIRRYVSRQVFAMILLQLRTGMRPGEVVQLRGCDLDRSGKEWSFTPRSHKTEHHGRARVIFIGRRAQRIIRKFLKADPDAFLFSPADARVDRESRHCVDIKSSKTDGHTRLKDGYDVTLYRRSITRGCELASQMPAELKRIPSTVAAVQKKDRQGRARTWRNAHCWHPNQLRHWAATRIRRAAGIETARTVLGHSDVATTSIYAERDLTAARQAMASIG